MKKPLLLHLLTLLFFSMVSVCPLMGQISVTIKEKPLKEALQILEKESGYSFFYSSTLPDTDAIVSLEADDQSIEWIMNRLLDGLRIDYAIKADKQITLSAKRAETPQEQPQRQEKKITGKITDTEGNPIIGANIILLGQGNNNGTTADYNGRYSLNVSGPDAEIMVSFLGYKTQNIRVGNRSVIDVVLEEEAKMMEEVVVVGYGTQKKVNLTGAVSMVTSDDLSSRPMATVSSALQGMLPGVTVRNMSGQPGSSNTTIRIRGIGTLGNANPLILIDGVEGDISALNPEDIESVSVLKDAASSAIYGARAANGVLLITTRKLAGNQKPVVNFGAYYGIQTPTRLPEMCDAIEFMTLDNEARSNVGVATAWFPEDFDKVRNNTDPNHFGNTNWIDSVLKDYAPQQNYTLSVNGSFGDTGYMLSYRYFDQDGLTIGNTTGEQRHNFRYKMDSKFLDRVTLSSNISYIDRNIVSPYSTLNSGGGAIYTAMRIAPNVPIYYTDGTWAYGGGNTNPVAVLTDGGNRTIRSGEFSLLETLKIDILKEKWNVTGTYNMTTTNTAGKVQRNTIVFRDPENGNTVEYNSPNYLSNESTNQIQQTLILQSNFDVAIKKHNISGVVGMSQEWLVTKGFEASRYGLATEKDPTLNLGDPTTMSNTGEAAQWALRSGFGRVSYNFDERYLFEANMRYDLSSRFHHDNRGGLFPSFSGAWRLTEEKFMEFSRKWFDNIKVRASWGKLGNQYVGSSNYPYMSILTSYSSNLSLIGTNATTGYTQSTLANPNLSWETITMLDFGIDLSMFSNRLAVSFDWFDKDTDGILLQLNYPAQIGAKPTEENVGAVNNKGWELDVSWNDKLGDFTYGVSFNISDVKNKITDLGGTQPDLSGYQIRRVGDPIDAFYGYIAEGLMTPDDFDVYDEYAKKYELQNIPVVTGYDYEPGDIKYKDISGPNGVPDGRISPEYDKVVIGSAIPRYTYSFKGFLAYKNLDFDFTLQGVGKCDGYLTGSARHAFQDMAGYPQKIHQERYNIETNPDPNASYPRLTYNTSFNQSTFSTYWLEDASYLRLKNIQIGYSLPKRWLQKARIDKCRIYLSADNLFTVSDFFYAYDPETPIQSGGYYPQVKTFVMGINFTFK